MKNRVNKQEEITLTNKQLKGLELLSKIDLRTISSREKLSWVGKVFQWVDINIFDKSTRLWMYLLEASGAISVFVIIGDVQHGLHKIATSTTELELRIAESYVKSLIDIAPALAAMIASICAALPAIMGIMRSVNVKWKNGHGGSGKVQRLEKEEDTPSGDETLGGA